jgi:hypothetical protein
MTLRRNEMDDMNSRKKALAMLMGDMDGIEGKGMFEGGEAGASSMDGAKGVDVTISVVPRTGDDMKDDAEAPGGDTMEDSGMSDEELRGLPPFMRKGRK